VDDKSLSECFFHDEDLYELQSIKALPRQEPGAIAIGSQFILFIGGKDSKNQGKSSSSCDFYNYQSMKWGQMPSLQAARCKPGLFYFEKEEKLYAVGGTQDRSQFIEYISIDSKFNGSWEMLNLNNTHSNLLLQWNHSTSLIIDETKVLLMGKYLDGIPSDKVVSFNPRKSSLSISESTLNIKDDFSYHQNCQFNYNNRHYILSNSGNMHIYNGRKWIVIQKFIN